MKNREVQWKIMNFITLPPLRHIVSNPWPQNTNPGNNHHLVSRTCKSQVSNGARDIYSNNIPLPEKIQWKTVKYNERSWTL